MMDAGFAAFREQVYLRLTAALAVLGLIPFVPAGSLTFWQDLFAVKSIGQATYDNCKVALIRFYLFGDPSLVIFDKV
jgi:hypothetical protein